MEENVTPEDSSSNAIKLIIPIVVIVVIAVGVFFMLKNKTSAPAATTSIVTPSVAAMQEQTTPQAGSPSGAMSAKEITVDVVGSNFAFDKKEIRVKKGQKVTINFTNKEGMHDWVIDEFNARTSRIAAVKTESVTFTADKIGTFEYYCSVGSHRQMGMKGSLIVE